MIVRGLHYVVGAVLGALLLLGLASNGLAQTDALSLKASEAAEIAAVAQQNGNVRVIVMFASPVPADQLKSDPSSVANMRGQVAAAQDAIVATHFDSATNPRQGQGFDRALTRFPITPGFAVNVSPSELQALANDPRVTRINRDRAVPHSLIESVPLIGMTAAYPLGATGAGQAVAVLDTGVKLNHEFLTGKVVAEACFSNGGGGAGRVSLCPGGGNSQTGAGAANADTAQCLNGGTHLCQHGTHVAGIAAGLNTNQQGGEPPNGVAKNGSIFAIQVFTRFNNVGDCSPSAAPCLLSWDSDQISALDHVFANVNLSGGVKVASANLSLGGGLFSGTCDGASQKPSIDNLRGAGVLTAIAAGNGGETSQISSPACISSAVAVGSTTEGDTISSFSNMSAVVDVLAPGGGAPPGTNILSSVPVVPTTDTTTYLNFQGTSMATPHVAGAIAAIRSACPSATADAIENALKSTGTPITDARPGGTQTKPRIRVDLTVQQICRQTAEITTPPPGSTLSGASVTFGWTAGAGVSQYWLGVGTTPGGHELYTQSQGTNLSATVNGLPTNGSTVYVRLWWLLGGTWQFHDYTYTAATVADSRAVMTTPSPGSTLSGASVTFGWTSGSGVSQYWLSIGTTFGGHELYTQSQGTNLSTTVNGLPTNGATLYVRLWSLIAGVWQFNDYTYTAATVADSKAVMTTPPPGSTLSGATVTFGWTSGSGVSMYWLGIGTTFGGHELYTQSQGTNLSTTVNGLPTNGATLYVRLWSLIAGVWQFNDYTYTAASG